MPDELKAAAEDAAKRVVEELEKNPVAAKVIEQVKTTAEQIEGSRLAADVRAAARTAFENIEKHPLTAALHRLLLASFGAVALAQDEMEDLVNRLVERGAIAEADGKRMLKDVLERRKQAADRGAAPQRAPDDVEQRVAGALAQLNIPTKDEIEALSAKITVLSKKVDELKKAS